MKKKLLTLALLTISVSSFADPISAPNNLNDTVVVSDSNGNNISDTGDSGSSSYKIIDLSNVTSDYNLKVGETAVVKFNNVTSVPLHIAVPEPSSPTQPVIYEITVTVYQASDKNIRVYFNPNNNSYQGQFKLLTYAHGDNGWVNNLTSTDRFYFDIYLGSNSTNTQPYIGTFKSAYYGAKYKKHMVGEVFDYYSMSLSSVVWDDVSTPWTSLGTFGMFGKNFSGQIIVKRIS
ncbi:MAG: hypothetical protein JHC33_00845 [Ignisphaera sp.]|nr:hypothetical protein [Ignisphaera sp.]